MKVDSIRIGLALVVMAGNIVYVIHYAEMLSPDYYETRLTPFFTPLTEVYVLIMYNIISMFLGALLYFKTLSIWQLIVGELLLFTFVLAMFLFLQ